MLCIQEEFTAYKYVYFRLEHSKITDKPGRRIRRTHQTLTRLRSHQPNPYELLIENRVRKVVSKEVHPRYRIQCLPISHTMGQSAAKQTALASILRGEELVSPPT